MNTLERPPTAFEQKVYDAICEIPKGKVTTYKHLADSVGCGSSQAIGQALKRNPNAPEVPCHRVIKTDLTVGGFAGEREGDEITRKLNLLEKEGVQFANGKLVEADRVFAF